MSTMPHEHGTSEPSAGGASLSEPPGGSASLRPPPPPSQKSSAKPWWRRWWVIAPTALVAAYALLVGFMYFVGAGFLDARAGYELDSAMDALDEHRFVDAVANASKAIDLSVSDQVQSKAYLVRASAHFELRHFPDAADDATTAIELATGSRPGILAVSYALRAQTHLELQHLDEAVADATTAIGLAKHDDYAAAVAHLARGAAYLQAGDDPAQARTDLEQGVQYANRIPKGWPPSFRQRVSRAHQLLRELDD